MSDLNSSSEFTVSSVLRCAWEVLWKRPMFFFGIALIINTIFAIFIAIFSKYVAIFSKYVRVVHGAYGVPDLIFHNDAKYLLLFILLCSIIYLIIFAIYQCAITYAAFSLLMDSWISVPDSFKQYASRIPSVILGIVIFHITILLTIFVSSFVAIPLFLFFSKIISPEIISIVPITFVILLIINWFVFIPACMIEQVGATKSLSRSVELTKGYRMKTLCIVLLMFLVTYLFNDIAFAIFVFLFESEFIALVFFVLFSSIAGAYIWLLPAITYYKLRVAKENFTLDSLVE